MAWLDDYGVPLLLLFLLVDGVISDWNFWKLQQRETRHFVELRHRIEKCEQEASETTKRRRP